MSLARRFGVSRSMMLKVSPRLAVVSHFQELTHSRPGRRTFTEAQDRKTAAEEEGVHAIVPFWGDRMEL